MAEFDIKLSTRPMAETIESVMPHVDGTTEAVVAMQVAVIEAEQHAADSICDNVNRGFYTLIRSQISQKIAAIQSQLDARLLELRDQARKMLDRKRIMERDFQMIAKRNMKLFASLDATLFNRVHELDRPAVDLVTVDLHKVDQRYVNSQAALPVHQIESVRSAQLIAASRSKAAAAQAIQAMDLFIVDSTKQSRLTLSILSRGARHEPAILSLPFIVAEVDSAEKGHSLWRQYLSAKTPQKLARTAEQTVRTTIFSSSGKAAWKQASAEDRRRVEEQFRARLAHSTLSDRVKQQMMRLFAAAGWLQLGKERA